METQLTIRLPESLHDRLARAAKALDRKRSDIARMAIQRFLEDTERGARARPYEQVQDLLSTLDSGVSDLGSRHRDHLVAYLRRRG